MLEMSSQNLKRVGKALLLCGLILLIRCVLPAEASGFGRGVSFLIPPEHVTGVRDYLKENYGNDPLPLKEMGPGFSTRFSRENVYLYYFDTPGMLFLENRWSIGYSVKITGGSSGSEEIKKEEFVDIHCGGKEAVPPLDPFTRFTVRHYNRSVSFEEKHPLVKLVRRAERRQFKDVLKKRGIQSPLLLKPVLPVLEKREKFDIYYKDRMFVSIVLLTVESETFGISTDLALLTLRSHREIGHNSNEKRAVDLIRSHLPGEVTGDREIVAPGYPGLMDRFREKVPFFIFLVKNPVISDFIRVLPYALGGLFFLVLFSRKRLFSRT